MKSCQVENMRKSIHVVVVGGGIGGLTTARALALNGVKVTVFDQASQFTPTAGAGFGFSPNGQICLSYLGLADKMEPYLHNFHYHHVRGDGGRVLYDGDHLKTFHKRVGLGLGGALRADLVNVLVQSLDKDTVQYNKRVVGLEQSRDSVKLTLADSSVVHCDLVIGADGINSTIAKVTGLESKDDKPIYSGENIFYGVVDHIPSSQELGNSAVRVKMHELFQIYSRGEYIQFPVGSASSDPMDKALRLVWAQTYKSPSPPKRPEEEWTRSNGTSESVMNYIETYLKHAGHPADHPIYQMLPLTVKHDHTDSVNRLLHFGLFYRKAKSRWHQGRVALLGDSCHATLPYAGQGANQAIEDAVVLSQCLEECDYNPDKAFPMYYEKRFKRTQLVVDSAKWMGRMFHTEGAIGGYLRDQFLQYLIKSGLFMKIAEKEIVDNCPVKLVDWYKNSK